MNVNLERILIFSFGGVIGSIIASKIIKKKHDEEIKNILKSVDEENEYLKFRVDELETILDIRSLDNDSNTDINPPDKIENRSQNDTLYDKTIKVLDDRGKIDYTAYSRDLTDEEEAIMAGYEHPEDDDQTQEFPYLISRAEFVDDCKFYTKEDLKYYARDHVLVDSDDEIIDDISGTIGDEALDSFGEIDPDEPDICHVRNDRRSIDYEITKLECSYHEDILGIYDDV